MTWYAAAVQSDGDTITEMQQAYHGGMQIVNIEENDVPL